MTEDTRQMIISHMDSGFRAVNLRIDDKHDAVMERLDSVVEKQDQMADRHEETAEVVHRHSGMIEAIQREIGAARDRWHERFNELQRYLGMAKSERGVGELANVTRLDLKTAAAIFVSGATALLFVLKMMGKV